jgi:hypothetical protein
MNSSLQILSLFVISIPIASISWTVTHEEICREFHEFCTDRSKNSRRLSERKFFYLFTCDYCFSHYVTALFLLVTRYKLLFPGWRGYLIAGLSLVWVSNMYMSIFNRLRLELKKERVQIKAEEAETEEEWR